MAKMATSWTFCTTRALIAWMQDEYLSELTLEALKITPPKGPPQQVEFVWRLHGLGNGQTQPYRVVATGVRRFEQVGSIGAGEVSFADVDLDAARVVIAMAAPCRIALTCDQVVVSRGRKTKKIKQNRPYTDYAYFSIKSQSALSLPRSWPRSAPQPAPPSSANPRSLTSTPSPAPPTSASSTSSSTAPSG